MHFHSSTFSLFQVLQNDNCRNRKSASYSRISKKAKLLRLQQLLSPLEEQTIKGFIEPEKPIVFIVGPPCSGTTLAAQVLATQSGFSGISNLHARFWNTPVMGAHVSNALGLHAGASNHFESVNGVTEEFDGIHEFGYFWDQYFDLGQETHHLNEVERSLIDTVKLKQVIAAMEAELGGHLYFKNNTWCTFQADWLANIFPKAVFIICQREPSFVAQSMYLTRLRRYGNSDTWWSMKPENFAEIKTLNAFDQISAQAYWLSRYTTNVTNKIIKERRIVCRYSELCQNPASFLKNVSQAISTAGSQMPLIETEKLPKNFLNRNHWTVSPEIRENLTASIKHLEAQYGELKW